MLFEWHLALCLVWLVCRQKEADGLCLVRSATVLSMRVGSPYAYCCDYDVVENLVCSYAMSSLSNEMIVICMQKV